MNKLDIEWIDSRLTLYRNDSDPPPSNWSRNFKNPRYNFENVGDKNRAGFFFLTDSIDLAEDKWWQDRTKGYYLTTCYTGRIHILDFSLCTTIMDMMFLLHRNNFDFWNLKTYEDPSNEYIQRFDEYRADFDLVMTNYIQNEKSLKKINSMFGNVGIFGQKLTDVDNGTLFHNLLKQWDGIGDSKIDGYRFRESDDLRGYTYCFFDSDKLSPPKTTSVSLEEGKERLGIFFEG